MLFRSDVVVLVVAADDGALGMNMVDSYINRKHEREEVTYGHEAVEKILGTTYGVIVYQEQVMQIAQDLSGFTLGQADILRRSRNNKKTVFNKSIKNFIWCFCWNSSNILAWFLLAKSFRWFWFKGRCRFN